MIFYAISNQFLKKLLMLQRWKLKHWSKNAISYLTVHNITSAAYWQKQLRWRTRPGNSPGYPGLPRATIKQTPHRLPPDETTWGRLPFPRAPTLAMPWLYQGRRCPGAKPSLILLPPIPPHPKERKPRRLRWAGTTRGLPPLQAEKQTCWEILWGTPPLILPNKSRHS